MKAQPSPPGWKRFRVKGLLPAATLGSVVQSGFLRLAEGVQQVKVSSSFRGQVLDRASSKAFPQTFPRILT